MIFLRRYWEAQSKNTIKFSHLLIVHYLENGCINHWGKIKTRSIYSKRKKNKIKINYAPEVHGDPWNIFLKTHIKELFTSLSHTSSCWMCYNYISMKK